MLTKEWTPGHATRARSRVASDSMGSRPRRSAGTVRRRVESAHQLASPGTRARRSFFWPVGTQQVARTIDTLSLRDVSAAITAAGAFALWALALSLLVG